MYLNRSLIKRQAKDLIRGNVFKLFLITFIVTLCVSLISGVISGISGYRNALRWSSFLDEFSNSQNFEDYFENFLKDNFGEEYGDYFDEYFDDYFDEYFGGNSGKDDSDHFNGFGDDGWDFNNFGFEGKLPLISAKSEVIPAAFNNFRLGFFNYFSYLPYIITVLLAPLSVTLAGLYVSFIRGRKFEFDEGIRTVFTDAFKVNYLKKVGVNFLIMIITTLLSMLFIIPGIIFAYSAYFAYQVMCDYPQLSAWEAIKLSKKMIKGNRFELFVMNLSFIPWMLLCVFVFPIIYVMPYIQATNALYYENFRIRAIQQGRVTEDDFLSDAQRCAKYGAMGNNQYHSPTSAQQGTYYHTPQQPPQQQQYYAAPNNAAQYAPSAAQPQPAATDIPTPPAEPVVATEPIAPAEPIVPQGPAEPQEEPNNSPKPAEPTDYPWEG